VKRAAGGLQARICRALWTSHYGLTALLVDDDSDALEVTALLLRLAGADVSVTSSVEDALHLLEEQRWDVVITDIGMPRLSGYDLIRRARQRGYDVPMIAVTGFDTPNIETRSSGTGSRIISSGKEPESAKRGRRDSRAVPR
jgi:CheY-like chemotaxis protein